MQCHLIGRPSPHSQTEAGACHDGLLGVSSGGELLQRTQSV